MMYEHKLLMADSMTFEDSLDFSCRNREVPGVILAANARGLKYAKAFGTCSLNEGAYNRPLRTDSILWIAACTELQTTVAALQCVERGMIHLDEDVTRIVPELRDAEILTGFDPRTGIPILVKRTKVLTLRQLLTHTSGIAYDHFSPILQKYLSYTQELPNGFRDGKVVGIQRYPLVFEPGTSWEYGAGVDWAGQTVERLTGLPLGQYMQTHIWQPLGMRDTTFRLHERHDLYARCMDMSQREGLTHPVFLTTLSPDGKVVPAATQPKDERVSDDVGGSGVYSSVVDFAKVLDSLCSNDNKLLHESTVDSMFTPQLGESSRARLAHVCASKEIRNAFGGLPSSVSTSKIDYGLGGMMEMEEEEMGGERKGRRMFGSGMSNIYWWMERKSRVSGVFGTQLMPMGDPTCVDLMRNFEINVYETLRLESGMRGGGKRGCM